jgi:hypothetical protein
LITTCLLPAALACCTLAALQTSYQLNDADYSGGDLEGGWVVRLAGCLQLQLMWLQPLLTPACWEGLTLLLLDKLLARLEVLLGRKVGGFLAFLLRGVIKMHAAAL